VFGYVSRLESVTDLESRICRLAAFEGRSTVLAVEESESWRIGESRKKLNPQIPFLPLSLEKVPKRAMSSTHQESADALIRIGSKYESLLAHPSILKLK